MNKKERAEIEAAISALIADEGDHVAAIEKLCRLVGRRVEPLNPGDPIGVLQASAEACGKGANVRIEPGRSE